MRSLPFPRRLQLVKLLRAHGLRDVERLREDELKEALAKLAILLPDLDDDGQVFVRGSSEQHMQTMTSFSGHQAEGAAPDLNADWADDPQALPRFREKKVSLPDGERTFLRVIAQKPGSLFFTWDLAPDQHGRRDHHNAGQHTNGRLYIKSRNVNDDGHAVDRATLLQQQAHSVVDVDLRAPGWMVHGTPERAAVAAVLVADDGTVLAESNVALTVPSRPAPAGPLWVATVPVDVDRRWLKDRALIPVVEAGAEKRTLPRGVVVETQGVAFADPSDPAYAHLQDEQNPSSSSLTSHRTGARNLPDSSSSSTLARGNQA